MVDLTPPLRLAVREDAPQLAELVNFASEGFVVHIWQSMAAPGEDAWEVGRRRQAQKAAEGQVYVIDEGGTAIAGLTGYAIGPEPAPLPDMGFDIIRVLQALENQAPSSWYVNVIAAFPEHRGKGLGTRLLGLAEALAREAGLDRLSLIVADNNTGGRRLYERLGFRETARAPVPEHEHHIVPARHMILMIRDL